MYVQDILSTMFMVEFIYTSEIFTIKSPGRRVQIKMSRSWGAMIQSYRYQKKNKI